MPEPAAGHPPFLHEAAAGIRTIVEEPNVRVIIGLYGCQTLVAGALRVFIVVIAFQLLDTGNAGVGFLNSATGIGGLVGALATHRDRQPLPPGDGFRRRRRPLGPADRPDRDLAEPMARPDHARRRRGRQHDRRRRCLHAPPACGSRRGARSRLRRPAERSARDGRARQPCSPPRWSPCLGARATLVVAGAFLPVAADRLPAARCAIDRAVAGAVAGARGAARRRTRSSSRCRCRRSSGWPRS